MAVLLRILGMIVAYILACVAAAIVLAVSMLTPAWDDLTSLGVQSAVLWSVVGVGAALVTVVAMLPSLLIIALAEGFAWRSSVLYALLGGALALALRYGLDFVGYMGEPHSSYLGREREVVAAAGIAGGLVYWLFAGRKAGSWQR